MKLLIYGDVHWSKTSSVVDMQGKKFTKRIELLINSMNWVNDLAVEQQCEATICVGDFFHRTTVAAQETTALLQIHWADMPHYFLVGNHEAEGLNLEFRTIDILDSNSEFNNKFIISEPCWNWVIGDTQLHFIPYIEEVGRKPIEDYLDKELNSKGDYLKQVIISHNDLAGVLYGGFPSKIGFNIKEIEDNCDLFLNGHIHNSEWVTGKILNLGSLSGHNFTNDASKYNYGAWILDTETLQMTFFENPYSLNFYKLSITEEGDLQQLYKLKPNAVVSVQCTHAMLPAVNDSLKALKEAGKIITSKLSTIYEATDCTEAKIEDLSLDHLAELTAFCKTKLGSSEVLNAELAEICK